MKIIFGFVGILLVLAIIGSLTKTQLQLLTGATQSATRVMDPNADPDAAAKRARDPAERGGRLDVFPGAVAADPMSIQQQTSNVKNDVRDRVNQNLQKGADRSNNAQQ